MELCVGLWTTMGHASALALPVAHGLDPTLQAAQGVGRKCMLHAVCTLDQLWGWSRSGHAGASTQGLSSRDKCSTCSHMQHRPYASSLAATTAGPACIPCAAHTSPRVQSVGAGPGIALSTGGAIWGMGYMWCPTGPALCAQSGMCRQPRAQPGASEQAWSSGMPHAACTLDCLPCAVCSTKSIHKSHATQAPEWDKCMLHRCCTWLRELVLIWSADWPSNPHMASKARCIWHPWFKPGL